MEVEVDAKANGEDCLNKVGHGVEEYTFTFVDSLPCYCIVTIRCDSRLGLSAGTLLFSVPRLNFTRVDFASLQLTRTPRWSDWV